ncbi:MAG: hypothetical protein M1829_002457 [Trizodia sp. TS-e1964]|nr:MAG: hypothetical protein M1829_002457 [Trizodia sp. TS-e1964]
MSENGELMAKIGHLAGMCHPSINTFLYSAFDDLIDSGQINLHKNHQFTAKAQQPIYRQSTSYGTADISNIISSDKTVQLSRTPPIIPPGYPSKSQWQQRAHGSLSYSRGTSTRPSHTAHRNRTLVLNTPDNTGHKVEDSNLVQGSTTSIPPNPTSNPKTAFSGRWIAKRDRHIQIINPLIYEKETQARSRALEETRKLKLCKRDEREKAKVNRYLHRLQLQAGFKNSSSSTSGLIPAFHRIVVQGVRFQVTNGGSKLVKMTGKSSHFPDIPNMITYPV